MLINITSDDTSNKEKKAHPNKIVATDDISSSMVLSEKATIWNNNLEKMKKYIDYNIHYLILL